MLILVKAPEITLLLGEGALPSAGHFPETEAHTVGSSWMWGSDRRTNTHNSDAHSDH